jgi:lipoprotein-releasing system ATP-binding protein
MNDVLQVAGLNKSYRSGDQMLHVIRDLALTLRRGRMLAVTGASGSGKSTLLHLLGAMEKPDSGQIVIDGIDVTRLGDQERPAFRNSRIGFVFQFHHLLPEFTALENVMFPLLLRRVSVEEASRAATILLEELQLGGRLHHRPGELSGGEQQRVAIARALSGRPVLLLADEPTGNLDPKTSHAIYEVLIGLHSRYDITSVIVTHNQDLASVCDGEMRMVDGALVLARG